MLSKCQFDSGSVVEAWKEGMRFESVGCLRKTNNTDGPSVKVCAESHTGAHRSGIFRE